jgi:phosphoglycolate phosphatase-like HAD superfamily hydrolase
MSEEIENQGFTQEQVEQLVSEAVKRNSDELEEKYKSKNQTLLDEKKQVQEKLREFDGMEPEQIKRMMKAFSENEEAQLIADGKFEEVIQKRMDSERAKFTDQQKEIASQLETVISERDNYRNQYQVKLVDIELRAAAEKAGVVSTAIEDVVSRGLKIFSIDESGQVEARDAEGYLVRTDADTVLNPETFIEGLKTSAPHYWPQSEGSGASGNRGGSGLQNIDERMNQAAERGDIPEFQRLRKLKQSGG